MIQVLLRCYLKLFYATCNGVNSSVKGRAQVLKAVSLYTGIGGLDFGFEAAGFETVAAVEMDAVACRTIRLNRLWPVLERDIHDIGAEEIMRAGGLQPGEADILIGGPPCQPFSKSSYWINGDAMRLDDPRSDTLKAYLRVLRDVRPKTFLLENVYGLAYKGKDEGLNYLIRGIEQINTETGSKLQRCMEDIECCSLWRSTD